MATSMVLRFIVLPLLQLDWYAYGGAQRDRSVLWRVQKDVALECSRVSVYRAFENAVGCEKEWRDQHIG